MKTRYFSIFGGLLAIIAILGFSGTALAQQNAQSDTLIYPFDSTSNQYHDLRDFGTVSAGSSECHTIYLKNSLSDPLIIQGLTQYNNNGYYGDFTVTVIPTLPLILLQNEIISLANICLAPVNPMVEDVSGTLVINGMSGNTSVYFTSHFKGKQVVDPLLSKNCDSLWLDANLFGPVIMDGDVTRTATLQSNRHDSLLVRMDTAIYGDGSVFSVSGITFPYMLAPQEQKTFSITFSPRSNVPKVKYRYVGLLSLQVFTPTVDSFGHKQYWNSCDYPKLTLPGVAIPPTADSISTALAAGSTDILAMIGDNSVTTKTFNFKNSGANDLKITGVSLKNNVSFSITDIQPTMTLPFTLTPGQSMSVTVAMTTANNGVYYDEVVITAENAFISMEFPLQGLRKDGITAGVHTSASSEHVNIYPNPTQGNISVAIPGIHNAKIEVLNVLGKVITTSTASDLWNWKSTEPAGTYVVHVSGTDEAGKSFQSYDRFIIAK